MIRRKGHSIISELIPSSYTLMRTHFLSRLRCFSHRSAGRSSVCGNVDFIAPFHSYRPEGENGPEPRSDGLSGLPGDNHCRLIGGRWFSAPSFAFRGLYGGSSSRRVLNSAMIPLNINHRLFLSHCGFFFFLIYRFISKKN